MKNIRGWGSSNPRSFQGEGFAPYSTQIQFEFSKKATKNMKKSPSCSKSYFLKTKCFEIFVAFIGNLKYKGGRGISHGPTSSNKRWKRERETQVRRGRIRTQSFFFSFILAPKVPKILDVKLRALHNWARWFLKLY